ASPHGLLIWLGVRVDQVQLEITQVQLLAEAGLLPVGLPGFLGYLPRLALADIPGLPCLLGTHRSSISLAGHPTDTALDLPGGNSPKRQTVPPRGLCAVTPLSIATNKPRKLTTIPGAG